MWCLEGHLHEARLQFEIRFGKFHSSSLKLKFVSVIISLILLAQCKIAASGMSQSRATVSA